MSIQIQGPLFEAVQSSFIFPDSKTFVDALPNKDISLIEKAYAAEKDTPNFDLKAFVENHFTLPEVVEEILEKYKTAEEYIEAMWPKLTRSMPRDEGTLISLPNPHIVPGGRFRECYYWDSYFVAEGLIRAGRFDDVMHLIKNFVSLIERFGHIPNGNRTYYLTRSQNPYFAHLLALVKDREGMDAILPFYDVLEKEYAFWMEGKDELTQVKPRCKRCVLLDDHLVLNRFWDSEDTPRPEAFAEDRKTFEQAEECYRNDLYRNLRAACESGWDFSARWLDDNTNLASIRTCDFVPIDLNCQLHTYEELLADMAKAKGDVEASLAFDRAASLRKRAIMRYFWNDEQKYFFDYDFKTKKQTDVWSLAGTQPLFVRIANQDQSDKIAEHLSHRFLQPGGLTTTLHRSSQQWDMPNGWAPLQWIAVSGLLTYNHTALAKDIAAHWLEVNRSVFKTTHTLLEKYNVIEASGEASAGEYEMQTGFGWTNAIYLCFAEFLR